MISVCIATYNGEKYIKEQIASILKQLEEKDEIIISDDGSNDETINIIKSFQDKRITIIEGPHKGSPIWNFENALKRASGDYIFLADQDDVWLENKVCIMMENLKKYDCIISDAIVVDGNLNQTSPSFFHSNNTKTGITYNLLIKNGYLGCCMAFRRNILEKSLPFPKNIPMHDIWIGNVASSKYKVKFISDKLILFRRHGHNNSTTASKSDYSIIQKIMFRINIIMDIITMNKKSK